MLPRDYFNAYFDGEQLPTASTHVADGDMYAQPFGLQPDQASSGTNTFGRPPCRLQDWQR